MKSNANISATCTLNADDIITLCREGEISCKDIVIGTTDPELEQFRQRMQEELCD